MFVKECNLKEFITIFIQSVVDNGVEVVNSMLKVRVTENVGQTLSQIQYIDGSKFIIIYEGEQINPEYKWAEL